MPKLRAGQKSIAEGITEGAMSYMKGVGFYEDLETAKETRALAQQEMMRKLASDLEQKRQFGESLALQRDQLKASREKDMRDYLTNLNVQRSVLRAKIAELYDDVTIKGDLSKTGELANSITRIEELDREYTRHSDYIAKELGMPLGDLPPVTEDMWKGLKDWMSDILGKTPEQIAMEKRLKEKGTPTAMREMGEITDPKERMKQFETVVNVLAGKTAKEKISPKGLQEALEPYYEAQKTPTLAKVGEYLRSPEMQLSRMFPSILPFILSGRFGEKFGKGVIEKSKVVGEMLYPPKAKTYTLEESKRKE